MSNPSTPLKQPPTLDIQDIENAVRIIDHACDKGVFTGWATIQQVFQFREKLSAFITYAKASQEAEAEAQSTVKE